MLLDNLNINQIIDLNFQDLLEVLKPFEKDLIDKYKLNTYMLSHILAYIFHMFKNNDRVFLYRCDILPYYDLDTIKFDTEIDKAEFFHNERHKLQKVVDLTVGYIKEHSVVIDPENVQIVIGIECGNVNIFHFHVLFITTGFDRSKNFELMKIFLRILSKYFNCNKPGWLSTNSHKRLPSTSFSGREGVDTLFEYVKHIASYITKMGDKTILKEHNVRSFIYTSFCKESQVIVRRYSVRLYKAFKKLSGVCTMKDDASILKHYLEPQIDIGSPLLDKICKLIYQEKLPLDVSSILLAKILMRLKQRLPLRLLRYKVYLPEQFTVVQMGNALRLAILTLRKLMRRCDIHFVRIHNTTPDGVQYSDILLYVSGDMSCYQTDQLFSQALTAALPKDMDTLRIEHDPAADLIFRDRSMDLFSRKDRLPDVSDDMLTYVHVFRDMIRYMPTGAVCVDGKKYSTVSQSKETESYRPSSVSDVQLSVLRLSRLIGRYMRAYRRVHPSVSRPPSAVS